MNLPKEEAWSEKTTQDGSERNVESKSKAEEKNPSLGNQERLVRDLGGNSEELSRKWKKRSF